jgi:hypothetical protein
MFIIYCSTILREEVKVGLKEVDFQTCYSQVFQSMTAAHPQAPCNLVLFFSLKNCEQTHLKNFLPRSLLVTSYDIAELVVSEELLSLWT